jgi:dTDP-4-dehydrorhamnose reductase
MRILILGHKGMLGSDLMAVLGAGHEVMGRDIEDVDIADEDSCRRVITEAAPEVVVNAAAYTNVNGCETDWERCFAVNATGVKNIARVCRKGPVKIIHFSTDYVFDGEKGAAYVEDDPCRPLNAYGRSKLAGERCLMEISGNYILVRTSWLYGLRGKNFVATILEKARTEKKLAVVDDQVGCPTYSRDLAGAVQLLIEGHHQGIFHITNRGHCSWYQFALKILQYAGMEEIAVTPVRSDQTVQVAPRPPYSVLSCRKYLEATGRTTRFWQIALIDYLEKMGYRRS